eukprot:TRINITY_DN2674_c0_g1_i1.p1 TRINITY_DN2674_c0_g1~~TRINITY_DN2674_c0_g1_i1.p1  ORF type:complete len:315 (-),score=60.12 TRINITY_DN2674_c0_g1_i1:105-1049(-)
MSSPVPIIDLSKPDAQVAKDIGKACEEIGFFIIQNHGFDPQVMDHSWKVIRAWFDQDVETKKEVEMSPEYPYGYSALEGETLSKGKYGTGVPDLKETFQICIGPKENPSEKMIQPRWPTNELGKQLQVAMTQYYRQMEILSAKILRLFAIALSLPEDWFEEKIRGHVCALRALNYPETTTKPKPGQVRASAHTDYGTLTILRGENTPGGLQVQPKGSEWTDVIVPENSFVINIGDLMQRWTNDKWISTLHRVVVPPENATGPTRRQSVAFFHNINPEYLVETIPTCITPENPARHEPIKAGVHLMQQHAKSNYS